MQQQLTKTWKWQPTVPTSINKDPPPPAFLHKYMYHDLHYTGEFDSSDSPLKSIFSNPYPTTILACNATEIKQCHTKYIMYAKKITQQDFSVARKHKKYLKSKSNNQFADKNLVNILNQEEDDETTTTTTTV